MRCALIKKNVNQVTKIKLPKDPKSLIEFYDKYIAERGIEDPNLKRKLYWAMFYCAKEGREWIIYEDKK